MCCRRTSILAAAVGLLALSAQAPAALESAVTADKAGKAADVPAAEAALPRHLKDEQQRTSHSIVAGGRTLAYVVEAGILVVHLKDPMDADPPPPADKPPPVEPEAGMSYYAYFLGKDADPTRPITFIYNGGPGSSTIWLHMGAFGPKRVVTLDDAHMPAAPYRIVENNASLLPESDLVFIDAPSTGFGHLRGADKEKAFFGVDQDAHAFANFITEFLSRHGRWNSPKYLFGESYGTTRSAVLAYLLQAEKGVDLNGVILLSQILAWANSADGPDFNPGVDQAYALALPTYAATAWYHKRLPNRPAELEAFLSEVETYALGGYLTALAQGSALSPALRAGVVAKLHAYTGLPAEYLDRANLRITGGVFEQHLLGERTAGRVDSRFSGPTIDPLGKEAGYDPHAAAVSSAYISAFNDYARRELKFGEGRTFKPNNYAGIGNRWDFQHQPPGATEKLPQSTNVMPDLAFAMKANPGLKVQLHSGYYDLATLYFAAEFELRHLPVPPEVAANIETKRYASGHMVYQHDASRLALHDNVADFICRTHAASDAH
jgi:carboxypeptidase C (cathepsin A)